MQSPFKDLWRQLGFQLGQAFLMLIISIIVMAFFGKAPWQVIKQQELQQQNLKQQAQTCDNDYHEKLP